jgi:hypothetical protein
MGRRIYWRGKGEAMRSTFSAGETITLSSIEVPPSVPPTPEEIARRQAHFVTVMALREEIGPIGISTDELVHAAREDLNDGDDQ